MKLLLANNRVKDENEIPEDTSEWKEGASYKHLLVTHSQNEAESENEAGESGLAELNYTIETNDSLDSESEQSEAMEISKCDPEASDVDSNWCVGQDGDIFSPLKSFKGQFHDATIGIGSKDCTSDYFDNNSDSSNHSVSNIQSPSSSQSSFQSCSSSQNSNQSASTKNKPNISSIAQKLLTKHLDKTPQNIDDKSVEEEINQNVNLMEDIGDENLSS